MSTRLWILIVIAAALGGVAAWVLFRGGDDDPALIDPAVARVEKLRKEKNVEELAKAVSHANESMARHALGALATFGHESLPQITKALSDPRPKVREKAATVFSQAADYQEAGEVARVATEDSSPDVRAAAVSTLDRMRAFTEMDALLAAMDDPDVVVRRRAYAAARRIACTEVLFKASDPPEKRRAALAKLRSVWQAEKARASAWWKKVHEMPRSKGGLK